MPKWLNHVAVFVGSAALGWYVTQGVDYLFQSPMTPDKSDPLQPNPTKLDEQRRKIDELMQSDPEGTLGSREIRLTWSRIIVPLETATSILRDMGEKSIEELPVDRQGTAIRLLSDLQVPLIILAEGGAPTDDEEDNPRIVAHYLVALWDLEKLLVEFKNFVNKFPAGHMFRMRAQDLTRALQKIVDAINKGIYGESR